MNRVLRAAPPCSRARAESDRGFTLVELMVSMTIFLILSGITFTSLVTAARTTRSNREYVDLNEEARLLLNRMSRELREAERILAVSNPGGSTFNPDADSSVRFQVDFNGNGVFEPSAADPEVLTYRYDFAGQRLVLQAGGATVPVLAANVADFKVSFTSRRFSYNGTTNAAGGVCGTTTGPKDTVVTWEEIDGHPSQADGDCDGQLDVELPLIDSVTIDLRVLYGARQQTYRTTVDLRNRGT